MLAHAFSEFTGFSAAASAFWVGIIILLGLAIGIISIFAIGAIIGEQLTSKTLAPQSPGRGLRGVPPADQYVVPYGGHPDCGGKFCELRGCAILGSCQAIP